MAGYTGILCFLAFLIRFEAQMVSKKVMKTNLRGARLMQECKSLFDMAHAYYVRSNTFVAWCYSTPVAKL